MRYSIGDLLYEYDKLYSEERADAWTALPNVTDVDDVEEKDEKKDRLLFSTVEVRLSWSSPRVLRFVLEEGVLPSLKTHTHF